MLWLQWFEETVACCSPGVRHTSATEASGSSRAASWPSVKTFLQPLVYQGGSVLPTEIQLYVGLDGVPHRAFLPTLDALRQHHDLSIGCCIVQDGMVKQVVRPAAV